VQQPDHPVTHDHVPVMPVVHRSRAMNAADLMPEIRRYMMMRPVVFGTLLVLLLLHLIFSTVFDLGTLFLLLGVYLLAVGSGGLEAARLSGTGGDQRRQERLAEDALRRAGRLQSHLDPCTATDDVVNRILASGNDPRRMVIVAGNEVEDALRAVYRHYSEAERMAGTSNGTDLPLTFLVQELIWRGLLPPDVYDTSEPILSLREIATVPRSQISRSVATDIARATQAVILRVQSLGIKIHPNRVPLAWLRHETLEENDPLDDGLVGRADEHNGEPEHHEADGVSLEDGHIVDGDRLEVPMLKEPVVPEPVRRELRPRQNLPETTDARQ
jgi:hypothetical protein